MDQNSLTPLSPNSDLGQIYHCIIKEVLVRDVMRFENMITHVNFP